MTAFRPFLWSLIRDAGWLKGLALTQLVAPCAQGRGYGPRGACAESDAEFAGARAVADSQFKVRALSRLDSFKIALGVPRHSWKVAFFF